jgi:acyl transferase domain-containing protein
MSEPPWGELPMTASRNDITNAHIGLREATRALTAAETGCSAEIRLSEPGSQRLAADLAATLDAVARLLRVTRVDANPVSPTAHGLHILAQHIDMAAAGARKAADGATPRPVPITDEPCGASG